MAETFITFSAPIESALIEHPEHVHAIGMISVEISNLECSLSCILGVLLNISHPEAEIVYFTPKAAIARLEVLGRLAANLPDKHSGTRERVGGLIDRAKAIIGKRHDIIHNSWGYSKIDAHVVRTAHPIKERLSGKLVPLHELQSLVDRIRQLNMEVWNEQYRTQDDLRPGTLPRIRVDIGGLA